MRHGLAVVLLVVAVARRSRAAVADPGVGRARRRGRRRAAGRNGHAARGAASRCARSPRHSRSSALAVPLAVMLDGSGSSRSSPAAPARSPRVVGACWLLAAGVVALLNLDAAVVLLTPLYVRTARRVGLDPVMLAFQPVLLAMLASGVLPVSNLTNLIVASELSLTSTDFLAHLALPSVVGVDGRLVRVPAGVPGACDGRSPSGRPSTGAPWWSAAARSRCSSCCSSAASTSASPRGRPRSSTIGVPRRRSHARCRGGGCRSARCVLAARARDRRGRRGGGVPARARERRATAACAASAPAWSPANVLNNLPATLVTLPHVAHVTHASGRCCSG